MRIPATPRFLVERERFALRFCCEDCALFLGERSGPADESACAHGFPTAEHRRARYEDPSAELVFCKEWECG